MPPSGEGPTKLDILQEQCASQTTYEGRQCRLRALAHTEATFDQEFLEADAWMADQPKSREVRAKYAAMTSAHRQETTRAFRQRMWERARGDGVLRMPILVYAAKQDTLSWDADDRHAMMRGELGFFDIVGSKNPRVKMIIINEAGHFPYREHPEQFNADLNTFIEFWNTRQQVSGTRRGGE
jgi:pimeloyl-ACP methyl ester carboxylesterase